MTSEIRFRYLETAVGRVHVAESGPHDGRPVVLLHQTPRSWDEYREVLGPLGELRRTIAIDTPGYGASDPPPGGHSIEAYAAGALAVIEVLGADRFDVVGHHTGGAVAIEVAAEAGERVERLVLSSTSYIDGEARAARRSRPHAMDAYQSRDDGSHLLELWRAREPYYPGGRPDLRDRCLADTLRAHDPGAGHRAVAQYEMETRLPRITAEVLCVGHEQDPHAMPSLEPMARALDAAVVRLPDGHVPLEHTATDFVAAVAPFLEAPGS